MRRVAACALLTIVVSVARPAWSCSLDGGLSSSSLSLQHPRSLDVALAVRDAIERSELRQNTAPVTALAILGVRSRLQKFALASQHDAPDTIGSFAVVIIEYGLWSRFRLDADGVAMQFHVEGPTANETVIVTSDVGLQAIFDGRMSARDAMDRKLIVLDAGTTVGVPLDNTPSGTLGGKRP